MEQPVLSCKKWKREIDSLSATLCNEIIKTTVKEIVRVDKHPAFYE